ncbi:NAD(P)H-dependent oxidoreductase [Marinoscillum sp. 108]|uniref:glutathione-regulated potassium-efflux system oxidoreductase KefF n=1 Tax=Marinoscillum sp. 108 TaxID=2653151 RepID=UPI0012F2BB27|nr:NAD(P)H-dependent oxidoreductase [Marinoscillum sp. 108]VXD11846.1 component of potassium effux complex with KefB [Marinoscillum sp. 108]
MSKILVLFAHPKFERSRVNKLLVEKIRKRSSVTFHDLYERYPDFNIDVVFEKELLAKHDIIIWHHPFYWYSCPPLMKQWIDVVLEFKWAYGPEGNALKGKQALNVLTLGGSREVYCAEGRNHFTVNEFLRPFEQTARLCGMDYLPPFAVLGTHRLSDNDLAKYAAQYDALITLLLQGVTPREVGKCDYFNDVEELKNLM